MKYTKVFLEIALSLLESYEELAEHVLAGTQNEELGLQIQSNINRLNADLRRVGRRAHLLESTAKDISPKVGELITKIYATSAEMVNKKVNNMEKLQAQIEELARLVQ